MPEDREKQRDEAAERKMEEASAKGGVSPDDVDEETGEEAAERQDRPGASRHEESQTGQEKPGKREAA